MDNVKRIAPESITDVLVQALEYADKFKHVVVIGETIDGEEFSQIIFVNNSASLANVNFLIDIVKQWCLTKPRNLVEQEDEDDA